MDFVTNSFRKDEPLTSWTLLQHICPQFWAWLLNTIAITPKSEDKYVVKVFDWSEVNLSEMTCYKIHTLARLWLDFAISQDDAVTWKPYSSIFFIISRYSCFPNWWSNLNHIGTYKEVQILYRLILKSLFYK